MNVFWRDEPLTDIEGELLELCLDAHQKSAFRNNFSSVAVAQSAISSGDLTKAITAALSMIGGMHAPLVESLSVLTNCKLRLEAVPDGYKLPGWGNSFEKGHPDTLWKDVDKCLADNFPEIHSRICEITDALHKFGKEVFPNPSCYTAAVGVALKMPASVLPWLFVSGRLNAWSLLFLNQQKGLK